MLVGGGAQRTLILDGRDRNARVSYSKGQMHVRFAARSNGIFHPCIRKLSPRICTGPLLSLHPYLPEVHIRGMVPTQGWSGGRTDSAGLGLLVQATLTSPAAFFASRRVHLPFASRPPSTSRHPVPWNGSIPASFAVDEVYPPLADNLPTGAITYGLLVLRVAG